MIKVAYCHDSNVQVFPSELIIRKKIPDFIWNAYITLKNLSLTLLLTISKSSHHYPDTYILEPHVP